MMWTNKEFEDALGKRLSNPNFASDRFSIDTRTLQPGDIYVALLGEVHDGHKFVQQALEKGASVAVVQYLVEGVDVAKQVLVDDTFEALRELAAYHRTRLSAKLVAVTGSVGKTSTKEALRTVLGTAGKTYATHGNFNNHIGTPLCLVNMPLDCAFGVFEMGMNHAGEISQLSALVQPHLAVITTVEAVHLEFFGSEEAIADAKAEIFDGMSKDGIAALPADNPHYLRLKHAAEKHGLGNIISFGVNELAVCRLIEYRADQHGSEVIATISGTQMTYRLGTIGRHWALTSVAVLAVADALGCDLPNAAEALANFKEPKGRGQLIPLPWDGQKHGVLLVDDSYNASPSSMKAAFEKMRELKESHPERRTIAVLGDMLELGDLSAKMHAALAGPLYEAGIDKVHSAGKLMHHLHKNLKGSQPGIYAETADALLEKLIPVLQAGDIVLVKGSHGSHMYKLAEKLEAYAASGSGAARIPAKGTLYAV